MHGFIWDLRHKGLIFPRRASRAGSGMLRSVLFSYGFAKEIYDFRPGRFARRNRNVNKHKVSYGNLEKADDFPSALRAPGQDIKKYRVDYKKIIILFMYLAILKEIIFKKTLF